MVTKHLVSDNSEREMHQTNIYLYGFYCRFRVNIFWLLKLVSWAFFSIQNYNLPNVLYGCETFVSHSKEGM
jgi:hypothetical protein